MLTIALGVIAAVISGVSLYKGGKQMVLHMDSGAPGQILKAQCLSIAGALHRCKVTYTFVDNMTNKTITNTETVLSHAPYRVGQSVMVYYNAGDPSNNSMQLVSGVWEGAGYLTLGAVSGVLAAFLLMRGRRRQPRVAFR